MIKPTPSETTFTLFDSVQLVEPIRLVSNFGNALQDLDVAPVGTIGTIVEVLDPDKAFLVELWGDWITFEASGALCRADANEPNAFRETLGVETVYAHQIAKRF